MQQLISMLASLTGIGGAESAVTTRLPPGQHDGSPLFGIPIELREVIYTYVLSSEERLLDPTHAKCQDETFTALLRTCRRIHNEARLHVHDNDTYVFSSPEAIKAFLLKSSTGMLELNITTFKFSDWTRCESWFDDWRGLLVPVPGHARDHDENFDLNTAIPRIDMLTIDLAPLSQTIHAQKPPPQAIMSASDEDFNEYGRWVYSAGAMNNGLLFILYAILHALNGVLPRPAWLQTSTVVRINGLSAEDALSEVVVELPASVEAIYRFIGLARDRNGFVPPPRLTGLGRYLLVPIEEADPAGAVVETVPAEVRRDSMSSPVGTSGAT